jgi:hypothetical protein
VKTVLLAAALFAAVTTASVPASAASLADQATCGKLAEKTAEGIHLPGGDWLLPVAESHYNDKLHLCIALVTVGWSGGYDDEKYNFHKTEPKEFRCLLDAVNGHVFGEYSWDIRKGTWWCHVEATPYSEPTFCHNSEDFNEAVRPYMTE